MIKNTYVVNLKEVGSPDMIESFEKGYRHNALTKLSNMKSRNQNSSA